MYIVIAANTPNISYKKLTKCDIMNTIGNYIYNIIYKIYD